LDKGGLQGGFAAVTDNLVWVVDAEIRPGASVKASQAFTPSEGGDFKGVFHAAWSAAPRSMKNTVPLGQGGTSGGF